MKTKFEIGKKYKTRDKTEEWEVIAIHENRLILFSINQNPNTSARWLDGRNGLKDYFTESPLDLVMKDHFDLLKEAADELEEAADKFNVIACRIVSKYEGDIIVENEKKFWENKAKEMDEKAKEIRNFLKENDV